MTAHGAAGKGWERFGESPHLFVDADACPVKEETLRVAERYGLGVTLVSNSWMRVPDRDDLLLVVVEEGLDVADDWIVEHVRPADIVISADVPLAARCLAAGALALGTTGREFTQANIGSVLATRDLLTELRGQGAMTGGPAPFTRRDRSRFLQCLDEMVHAARRRLQTDDVSPQ
jgi:uncharacterized protein